MVWKTLAEALESALASQMEKGTGAVEGPGQVREEQCQRGETTLQTTQPGTMPASSAKGRGIDTANPSRAPQRGVVSRPTLLVVEGGRPAGGGNSRAAYRAATREGSRVRELLKLVVG